MAPKRKSAASKKQQSIMEHALPLIKKPLEQIGKQVHIPGSFWQGNQTAEERTSTKYKCTVRDFTLHHKFPSSLVAEPGWELQEMGITGTGSTEQGDSSGEIFWMTNQVFLGFYYETFPDMMPQPKKSTAEATESDEPKNEEENAADGENTANTVAKPDVLPEFPHVRVSRAAVMKFVYNHF